MNKVSVYVMVVYWASWYGFGMHCGCSCFHFSSIVFMPQGRVIKKQGFIGHFSYHLFAPHFSKHHRTFEALHLQMPRNT